MKIIALDSIDGTGKSHQVNLLAVWWAQNYQTPVLKIEEPDASLPTGKLLRQLLQDGALSLAHAALFLADRLAIQQTKIIPFLEAYPDGVVISARCFLSTLVYQQDQWELKTLLEMHKMMPVKPDLIVVLDLDPVMAAQRMSKRTEDAEFYEKLDIQKRNRQRYRDLVDDPTVLLGQPGKVILIDASGTAEETHQKIVQVILENK